MYVTYCKNCGKRMEWPKQSLARGHCSKACYGATVRKDDDGPDMPPLNKDSISDEGYVCLVKAIVQQASDDVSHLSPNACHRISAEAFFLSPYFEALTSLDGKTILRKLHEEHRRRRYVRKDERNGFQ